MHFAFLLFACIAASGCGGETNQQAIDRHKPQFAQLRTKLKQLAGKLPLAGSVAGMSKPAALNPPVTFRSTRSDAGNTEIIMFDQLADPDAKLEQDKFDLYLSRHLVTALQWTGENNPMSSSVLGNSATVVSPLEQALATRYLVVVRTIEHERPQAVDEQTYAGGRVMLEVFLCDLESEQVLGSFPVEAQPPSSVLGTFREGDTAEQVKGEVAGAAHGALWKSAVEKVASGLEEMTGAKLEVE